MAAAVPNSTEELAEIIAGASAPFEIVGSGSKRGLGHAIASATPLSLQAFNGVTLYDPAELILEAQAATPLTGIVRLLASKGQQLAFEPPLSGTIGGAVACNTSGPRRVKAGSLRDHILMVAGVSGRGESFKAGARVVKNVTGYDLPKLFAGSFGTLAALTSVTLKVLPLPEAEATLLVPGLDVRQAVHTMSEALQSPNEVSGAAFVPGTGTLLRVEGIKASVDFRAHRLRAMFPQARALEGTPWPAIRDLEGLKGEVLWRVSLPPLAAPAYLDRLKPALKFDYRLDWGGGLAWIACESAEDGHAGVIRRALPSGHATLIKAPDGVRAKVDVFQPQPTALAELTRKVKAAYDPRGLLNPGRMYRGV